MKMTTLKEAFQSMNAIQDATSQELAKELWFQQYDSLTTNGTVCPSKTWDALGTIPVYEDKNVARNALWVMLELVTT